MNNASGMSCGIHANSDALLRSVRIILADGTVLDTSDNNSRNAFARSHKNLLDRIVAIRDEIMADDRLATRVYTQDVVSLFSIEKSQVFEIGRAEII